MSTVYNCSDLQNEVKLDNLQRVYCWLKKSKIQGNDRIQLYAGKLCYNFKRTKGYSVYVCI